MSISTAEYLRMQARLQGKRPDVASFAETKYEGDLHDEIIKECKAKMWPYIHSRMDMPSTIATGAPDFIIFLSNGRTVHIECKSKTGKIKPDQEGWRLWLKSLGHEHHYVRTFEDFLNAIATRKP